MGWASFLEDIEKRLDDAVRLYSPPDVIRGSISIESLQDTNDLLRMKNDELLKLLYAVKMDISSKKKQPDFCKDECVRLREVNDRLRRRLDSHRNGKASPNPTSKDESDARHQPEKVELSPQSLRQAKQPSTSKGSLKQQMADAFSRGRPAVEERPKEVVDALISPKIKALLKQAAASARRREQRELRISQGLPLPKRQAKRTKPKR